MIKHYSAGGIIALNSSSEPLYLFLLQRLPDGQMQWTCPKGHIDKGETSEEAARREIWEEAGISDLKKIKYLGLNSYTFTQDNHLHEKHIDWYLFTTKEKTTHILKEEGFIESKWLTYEEALVTITHKDFIPFLERARNSFLPKTHGKKV